MAREAVSEKELSKKNITLNFYDHDQLLESVGDGELRIDVILIELKALEKTLEETEGEL